MTAERKRLRKLHQRKCGEKDAPVMYYECNHVANENVPAGVPAIASPFPASALATTLVERTFIPGDVVFLSSVASRQYHR